MVTDIDTIVKQVSFTGWTETQEGDRTVQEGTRLVAKYSLPLTGPLFDAAYAYIRENYLSALSVAAAPVQPQVAVEGYDGGHACCLRADECEASSCQGAVAAPRVLLCSTSTRCDRRAATGLVCHHDLYR